MNKTSKLRNQFGLTWNLAALSIAFLICGCSAGQRGSESCIRTKTYEIIVLKDRISFRGFDDPEVVADRPDDVWEDEPKIARINATRHERMKMVVDVAMERLRIIVETADTTCLINSIRPGLSIQGMDGAMAQCGNWVLAEELCTREPFDEEETKELNGLLDIYMGENSFGFCGYRRYISEGRRLLMWRLEQLDKQRELKPAQPNLDSAQRKILEEFFAAGAEN